jgi:hypothetical protein
MSLAATLILLNLSRHTCLAFLIAAPSAAVFSHREFASTRKVHNSFAVQESNKRNTLHALVSELNTQCLLLKASIYLITEQGRPLNFTKLT